MTTPILETKRLILRPGKVSDAQAVFNNWTSDPDVAEFMRWSTHSSIDQTIAWLTDAEANVSDEKSYDWLFVQKETNAPIGSGGIYYNETQGMFEVGYGLMKQCWGMGYVTEAARAIQKFAICELNQTKLYACHAMENPASGKILEKLGFVYTGDGEYSSFDGKRTFKSRGYLWSA